MSTYERYPTWFVLLSNLITFSVYILGTFIVSSFGLISLVLYLCLILLAEIRLMTHSCVDCYYYGKMCFLGRGSISAWFFKKREPQRFIDRKLSWKDLILDFSIPVIPLLSGTILLFISFSWTLLCAVLLLLLVGFPVTGYLRSSLACKYCKQREIGCPAEQMFNKKKDSQN